MRLHISLDNETVERLDRHVGRRKRSAFIAETIRRALEDARRWDDIISALGKIADEGHDWDADPAKWVRRQRRNDARHAGSERIVEHWLTER